MSLLTASHFIDKLIIYFLYDKANIICILYFIAHGVSYNCKEIWDDFRKFPGKIHNVDTAAAMRLYLTLFCRKRGIAMMKLIEMILDFLTDSWKIYARG